MACHVRAITKPARAYLLSASLWSLVACSTEDQIGVSYTAGSAGTTGTAGSAGDAGGEQRTYPNAFTELLNKTDTEISQKLEADYQQLFHGDPATQAIYVQVGVDQAYLWDPRQQEVRSDGFANALLVSVELDHRDEFDALWRWANSYLVPSSGPLRDYVLWRCDVSGSPCQDEVQAQPHFTTVTALLLAGGRWGNTGGTDYSSAATRLMEAVFRAEPSATTSLGTLDGLIDGTYGLPRFTPYSADMTETGPSLMTPAFFALWAEKTGDQRAAALAEHARAYSSTVFDPHTGLVPDSTLLDGTLSSPSAAFTATSYGYFIAQPLDAIWFGPSFHEAQLNLALGFFSDQTPAGQYATAYALDGTPASTPRALLSLTAPLGASAAVASRAARKDFVQAVWDAQLDTGTSRKFGNLLYLMSSLILSGRLRVY